MEADATGGRFDEARWQQDCTDLESEIAVKIEQLSSKAEAITCRNRGNIPRATRPGQAISNGRSW